MEQKFWEHYKYHRGNPKNLNRINETGSANIAVRYYNFNQIDEGEDLDHREKEILQCVIQDYINNGIPVSSLQLVERYKLKWSSATIRNILAELSKKGYLFAPHRSAGKVPTAKGYRFYIKNLPINIPPYIPAKDKQNIIQREFLKRKFEIPDVLESSCDILSILTNYIGIAIPPLAEKAILRHIELLDVGGDEILMVLLTRSDNVYSKLFRIEEKIPRNFLEQISRFLNENFVGMDLRDIHTLLMTGNISPLGEMYRYASLVMEAISQHFKELDNVDVIMKGIDRFVEELESRDEMNIDVSIFYNLKEFLRNLLIQATELDDIIVSIEGDRNPQLYGLSILTGSYSMGDKRIGAMGLIGPNRMNYKYAIQIIDYLRIMLSNMITKLNQ